MSTRTLLQPGSIFSPFVLWEKRRLFLNALERIKHGRLTMITPEGGRRIFAGEEKGPDAYLWLHDWGVLDDLVARGEVAFVESYMSGRWDTHDLPALLTFGLANSEVLEQFFYGHPLYAFLSRLRYLMRGNSLSGSKKNIMAHYDLGNEFYALWLDKSMTYSCALFNGDETCTLEEAQMAKYRRIMEKLAVSPGDRLLEIGCGWGGFSEVAARHGVRVTGITISGSQADYARKRLTSAGLDHMASIQLMDYREIAGQFDHIVSIGMFEHVGENYWPVYFDTIKKCLKPGGKAMIQTITLNDYFFEALHNYAGFIEQVIFPGGMLPSKSRFHTALAEAGIECRETYSFGQDYARTTREWLTRFDQRHEEIKALGHDERFIRLWRFYLSGSLAAFTSHRTDVMQVELSHVAH